MIKTEAWVIKKKGTDASQNLLVLEEFSFQDISDEEMLVEPLFGCWEGNMEHALNRSPLDLCITRNEDRVVIGNAGVVRVLEVGKSIKEISVGDVGILFCNGVPDQHGYPTLIFGYDAPNTIGVLSKKTKLKRHQFIPIPSESKASLPQWAAFSLRYVTAWANWRVAFKSWRLQNEEMDLGSAYAAGWGGGVSLAELELARNYGFNAIMISSRSDRLFLISDKHIQSLDRRSFSKDSYEADFINNIMNRTNGNGVNIFVDNIGANFQAILKCLARQGVITTSGWRSNMIFPVIRSAECINRHTHIFTHYARYQEGLDAVNYAEANDWFPTLTEKVYSWNELPQLAEAYSKGELQDYFPIFKVN
ncbi:MAG: zinc-binding dehydrogenase [Alphaproteobacteria bacterium]|nr:zinc-binding dehydrogenase [Alphaproteobacteria bacterium]